MCHRRNKQDSDKNVVALVLGVSLSVPIDIRFQVLHLAARATGPNMFVLAQCTCE